MATQTPTKPKETQNKNKDKEDKKALTKADAAKMVKRVVPVLDQKNQPRLNEKTGDIITKQVSIDEDEVMSFAEYEDRVVVVTTSGEKLVAEK